MKTILLSPHNQIVKVDDEDYTYLKKYKWHLTGKYAGRRDYQDTGRTVYMHRLVVNAPEGFVVDHINHDELDNRKNNLRVVSQSDNLHNAVLSKNNRSGVNGVHFFARVQRWIAYTSEGGKRIHLGYFDTFEEAAKAREAADEARA